VLVLVLAVCVTLSFSGQGIAVSLFEGRVFSLLGKMSLAIYLNHMWVKDGIAQLLPASLGYWKLLSICIIAVLAASVFCMLCVELFFRLWKKQGKKITRLFLKES